MKEGTKEVVTKEVTVKLTFNEFKEYWTRSDDICYKYSICTRCLSYFAGIECPQCKSITDVHSCKFVLYVNSFVKKDEKLSKMIIKLCETCESRYKCFLM